MYMNDFQVVDINDERVRIRSGAISFDAYVKMIEGRKFVVKSKAIYINQPEWIALVKQIIAEHNFYELTKRSENADSIRY